MKSACKENQEFDSEPNDLYGNGSRSYQGTKCQEESCKSKAEEPEEKSTASDNKESEPNATGTENCTNNFKQYFDFRSEGQQYADPRSYLPKHETNVICSGIGNSVFHFGTKLIGIGQYLHGHHPQPQEVVKVKKTSEIRELLQFTTIIRPGHKQFLAESLGKEWEEVGISLGMNMEETVYIRNHYKRHNERAYEMLTRYLQRFGENATVGLLCTKLWKTKIEAAREAVHQLSLNLSKLN